MNEIKSSENLEPKAKVPENYKDIKSQDGTTYEDSKQHWKDMFSGNQAEKTYYDDNGEKYREGDSLEPNKTFEKNGYTYETDEQGRVISAEGKLQVKDHEGRNEITDSRDVVAHGEMDVKDDRGHLIADRFNGSGGMENLVPMDGKLNKGDYSKLESTLAEAVNDGADVRMKVEPIYSGDSNRPNEFRISYSIDGDKEVVVFKNRSDE